MFEALSCMDRQRHNGQRSQRACQCFLFVLFFYKKKSEQPWGEQTHMHTQKLSWNDCLPFFPETCLIHRITAQYAPLIPQTPIVTSIWRCIHPVFFCLFVSFFVLLFSLGWPKYNSVQSRCRCSWDSKVFHSSAPLSLTQANACLYCVLSQPPFCTRQFKVHKQYCLLRFSKTILLPGYPTWSVVTPLQGIELWDLWNRYGDGFWWLVCAEGWCV